jgi:hypothetical protein
VAMLFIGCVAVQAATPEQESTVNDTSIKEAISDSVWYDADKGVVPVPVKPVVDDSPNRDSRWLPKPAKVKQSTNNANNTTTTGGTGNGVFGTGLSLGNVFGWAILVVIIAALIGLLVYTFSKTELDLNAPVSSKAGRDAALPDEQTIERMKHLPAELRRTDVNLRSEAERLMMEGLYDQAIILLFGHQLLLLDRVGMLRLNRGKTNRKYIRETRAADVESSQRLQQTVHAFESSYFGQHQIEQQQFAELWESNAQLEQAVGRFQEVAV